MIKQLPATFFIIFCCMQVSAQRKMIRLDTTCSYNGQHREITDTLKNKTATITEVAGRVVLIIDEKKYFACNLPKMADKQKILVSGYVLQVLPYERLIGAPLKLTKASIR